MSGGSSSVRGGVKRGGWACGLLHGEGPRLGRGRIVTPACGYPDGNESNAGSPLSRAPGGLLIYGLSVPLPISYRAPVNVDPGMSGWMRHRQLMPTPTPRSPLTPLSIRVRRCPAREYTHRRIVLLHLEPYWCGDVVSTTRTSTSTSTSTGTHSNLNPVLCSSSSKLHAAHDGKPPRFPLRFNCTFLPLSSSISYRVIHDYPNCLEART